jgi:hypothetical protein
MNGQDPTNGTYGDGGDPEVEAALARYGGTLRRTAVWSAPPADLGDRILAQVAALRAGGGGAAAVEPGAMPTSTQPSSRDDVRRRRSRWWPALAAAAVVVAFLGGVLVAGGDDDDGRRSADPVADVSLEPTELAAGASASGSIVDAGAGYSISIEVAGLDPAPDGAYYEGWLHDEESGDWVSIGTFHMRGGDGRVVLWSGVPLARYAQMVVTSEVEGSSDGHGEIVLTGPVLLR